MSVNKWDRTARLFPWITAGVVVVSVALAGRITPSLVPFGQLSPTELVSAFTPFVLLALFVERILEVLMSAWRAEESSVLEAAVAAGSRHPDDFKRYKAGSQRIALAGGVGLGALMAFAGVRLLGAFVDPAGFA